MDGKQFEKETLKTMTSDNYEGNFHFQIPLVYCGRVLIFSAKNFVILRCCNVDIGCSMVFNLKMVNQMTHSTSMFFFMCVSRK